MAVTSQQQCDSNAKVISHLDSCHVKRDGGRRRFVGRKNDKQQIAYFLLLVILFTYSPHACLLFVNYDLTSIGKFYISYIRRGKFSWAKSKF